MIVDECLLYLRLGSLCQKYYQYCKHYVYFSFRAVIMQCEVLALIVI